MVLGGLWGPFWVLNLLFPTVNYFVLWLDNFFLQISRFNLPFNTTLHCNWYAEQKYFFIYSVAWHCRIHSQRYDILWKYSDKARITPKIDSDLARPGRKYLVPNVFFCTHGVTINYTSINGFLMLQISTFW